MKSKLLLGTLLIAFSAQSYATGTIECTGNNATNAKGEKVAMSVLVNTGSETNSRLASDVSLTPDQSYEKYISISKESGTLFRNTKGKLALKAKDSERNSISLTYDLKKQNGSMAMIIDGQVQTSNEVTCDYDF